jgi:streptogramin lyase
MRWKWSRIRGGMEVRQQAPRADRRPGEHVKQPFLLGILALTTVGLFVEVRAQQPSPTQHKHLMIVVEKGLPGATIYDADTNDPICDANVGIMSPHEAAFSLDGRTAYIPVYGSTNEGVPGTNGHAIDFFRTWDCQKIASLDTGKYERPHGMWVGSSGTLYVTSEIAQSLLLIDPRQQKIIATIPTGSEWTHMIAVTSDEKQAFASNVRSKTISVLDIPDRKLVKTIPTTSNNHRMTISRDQKWFVTSLEEGKVMFYRISDDQLDFSVSVDGWTFVGKFAADGLYYEMGSLAPRDSPSWGTGAMRVWKIDPASHKVLASSTDDLGAGTGSLAINPFNDEIYVTALVTNQIAILDPVTLKVIKRIPTKMTADGIEFTAVR